MTGKLRASFAAALAVVVLGLASMAEAKASERATTRVTVPFAFQVNGENFESGQYVITGSIGMGPVTLTAADGDRSVFLTFPLGNPNVSSEAKLVFYQVDGVYHLAEAWLHGSGMGKGFQVDKEVALLAKKGATRRIEVAMRR